MVLVWEWIRVPVGLVVADSARRHDPVRSAVPVFPAKVGWRAVLRLGRRPRTEVEGLKNEIRELREELGKMKGKKGE